MGETAAGAGSFTAGRKLNFWAQGSAAASEGASAGFSVLGTSDTVGETANGAFQFLGLTGAGSEPSTASVAVAPVSASASGSASGAGTLAVPIGSASGSASLTGSGTIGAGATS